MASFSYHTCFLSLPIKFSTLFDFNLWLSLFVHLKTVDLSHLSLLAKTFDLTSFTPLCILLFLSKYSFLFKKIVSLYFYTLNFSQHSNVSFSLYQYYFTCISIIFLRFFYLENSFSNYINSELPLISKVSHECFNPAYYLVNTHTQFLFFILVKIVSFLLFLFFFFLNWFISCQIICVICALSDWLILMTCQPIKSYFIPWS